MKFYHFTSRFHWRFIATQGITRGHVPVSETVALDHPNLTTDPDPLAHRWTDVFPFVKWAVRICLEISTADPLLVRWGTLAKQYDMPRKHYRAICEADGCANRWWVYQGTIRPGQFLSVDFLEGERFTDRERKAIQLCENCATYVDALSVLRAANFDFANWWLPTDRVD